MLCPPCVDTPMPANHTVEEPYQENDRELFEKLKPYISYVLFYLFGQKYKRPRKKNGKGKNQIFKLLGIILATTDRFLESLHP